MALLGHRKPLIKILNLIRILSVVPATYTKLPLKYGHLINQNTSCGPKGIRNREVPLYTYTLKQFLLLHVCGSVFYFNLYILKLEVLARSDNL